MSHLTSHSKFMLLENMSIFLFLLIEKNDLFNYTKSK